MSSDVAALQRELLKAALEGAPLEGGTAPVRLPDVDLVRAAPEVLVISDGVADPEALRDLPVRLVSAPEAADVARAHQYTPQLRFGPPEQHDGALRIRLELHLAAADGRTTQLGGVVAEFTQRDGRWAAAGDPVTFAA